MPGTTTAGRDLVEGGAMPHDPSPLISVSGKKWMLDGVPFEGTFAPRQARNATAVVTTRPFFRTLQLTFAAIEFTVMLREAVRTGGQLLVHVTGYPAAVAMLGRDAGSWRQSVLGSPALTLRTWRRSAAEPDPSR